MSETTQQLQAKFDALEDRILLRIRTPKNQLLEAWITRRFLKLLIPALQGKHPIQHHALFTEKQQAIHTLKQQQAKQESDFSQPFQEERVLETPLGKPILLTQLTFKNIESDRPQLVLSPEEGEGLLLEYDATLTGALLTLLQKTAETAQWDLTFPSEPRPASNSIQ